MKITKGDIVLFDAPMPDVRYNYYRKYPDVLKIAFGDTLAELFPVLYGERKYIFPDVYLQYNIATGKHQPPTFVHIDTKIIETVEDGIIFTFTAAEITKLKRNHKKLQDDDKNTKVYA